MRNWRFSLLLSVAVAGVMSLFSPEAVLAQTCISCQDCPSDPELNIGVALGASTHYIDEDEILDPEACFPLSDCDCLLAQADHGALSDLIYGEDVRISEWVEANRSTFEFAIVDGTLEVKAPSCGSVYTWVALDHPEEARLVREIIALD